VRALFLEGLQELQNDLDAAAKRSDDVSSHPEFESICKTAMGATPEHGSTMHLSTVAAFAIRLHVDVHLIDTWVNDVRKTQKLKPENERQMKIQTTQTAVYYRDVQAAVYFHRILLNRYAGQKARCLVLFGAAHFTGVNPGDGGWEKQQRCLADMLKLDYVRFT
jgi:hypothetical protein